MEAGIRELRNNLSRFLDAVKRGEELVVTDRGRAIARIVPVERPRAFDALVAEGLIEPAPTTVRSLPERVRASGSVSELVADQRR